MILGTKISTPTTNTRLQRLQMHKVLHLTKKIDSIKVYNSSSLPISGIEIFEIPHTPRILKNTLISHNFQKNLLSVSQFTIEIIFFYVLSMGLSYQEPKDESSVTLGAG